MENKNFKGNKDCEEKGFFGWQEPGIACTIVDSDGDGVLDTIIPCDERAEKILKGKSILDLLG
jgi:hypothetical protein